MTLEEQVEDENGDVISDDTERWTMYNHLEEFEDYNEALKKAREIAQAISASLGIPIDGAD